MEVSSWEKRKLGELTKRVTRKNINNESTLPLTISAQYGLIDQNIFFDKQVASKDVSSYFLIKNGEFAYNKSYSNGYPLGAIKRLDRYPNGVLSTLYIIFKPISVSSQFLVSYFDSTHWYKEVAKNAAEGARNHGLLNISPSDFFNMVQTIPNNFEEQNKVGIFFETLDNIIAVNQRKVDLLKELKKGFLQKMFPKNGEDKPEIRFSGFTDAWVQRKFADMFAKIGDGLHGTPQYDDNGDTAFINGNNLSNGNIVISDETKRVTEGQKSIADTSLTNQTILMSINGTIGSLAWYRGENVMLGKSVAYMIPDAVDSKFAYYELQTAKTMTHFKNALTGTTIKNLGLKAIRDRMLWVPKQDEQYRIGQLLYDLDNLIAANQRRVDLLKQEKKALLQKMFV